MRTCTKCGIEKELDQFRLRKTGGRSRRHECNECNAKWQAQYRKDNKEHIRYLTAARRYGISYEEAKMLYNGECKICGITPKNTLHIDHDHITDNVRGALCTDCNNGIARFKDNIALLTSAIEYLKKTANGGIMGLRYTIAGLLFAGLLSTAWTLLYSGATVLELEAKVLTSIEECGESTNTQSNGVTPSFCYRSSNNKKNPKKNS